MNDQIKCDNKGTLNTASAVCEAKTCINVQVPPNAKAKAGTTWKSSLALNEFNQIECEVLHTPTNNGKITCEKGELVSAKCESKWVQKKDHGISKVLYSWPRNIRSVTKPTSDQIEACALECEKATGCKAFVVRYDTHKPNMGDAICGLALQPYKSEWFEPNPNVSTYERAAKQLST